MAWPAFEAAAVSLTTIAANATVVIGGIWAGRKALQKLGAIVRLASVQASVTAERAERAPEGADAEIAGIDRQRVLFGAILDWRDRQDPLYARGAHNGLDLTRVSLDQGHAYFNYLSSYLTLMDFLLQTDEGSRTHWSEVLYAELVPHAHGLKLYTRTSRPMPALVAPLVRDAIKAT